MKLAVMQPYLFPYIGFYSLAASVDALVLRDTAQFPKGGWVNRNRMEYRHGVDWFTIPLEQSHSAAQIRHKTVSGAWSTKALRKKIEPSLYGAEYRPLVLDILESVQTTQHDESPSLLKILQNTISATFSAMEIGCEVILESTLALDPMAGVEGVIQICTKMGARDYHNLPGGRLLYSKDQFAEADINLRFVESTLSEYNRAGRAWIPSLSILDTLSQIGSSETRQLVFDDYTLD
jgi:hypothetical protein